MKVSLNEIFGKNTGNKQDLELKDLQQILGEKLPELPFNAIGRIRLIKSLRNRFGAEFRNIPRIRNLISKFDKEIATEANLHRVKNIKL